MVHFASQIGTRMAETPMSSSGETNSQQQSPDSPNVWDEQESKMVKIHSGEITDHSQLSMVFEGAERVATEVAEQMALLTSMKDDLDPERVASLLKMPAPGE